MSFIITLISSTCAINSVSLQSVSSSEENVKIIDWQHFFRIAHRHHGWATASDELSTELEYPGTRQISRNMYSTSSKNDWLPRWNHFVEKNLPQPSASCLFKLNKLKIPLCINSTIVKRRQSWSWNWLLLLKKCLIVKWDIRAQENLQVNNFE